MFLNMKWHSQSILLLNLITFLITTCIDPLHTHTLTFQEFHNQAMSETTNWPRRTTLASAGALVFWVWLTSPQILFMQPDAPLIY